LFEKSDEMDLTIKAGRGPFVYCPPPESEYPPCKPQGIGMDDKDKGMVEKTIEAVEEFVSEIKDAAKHMMDPPEPFQPGDELVMLPPMEDTGVLGVPMPPQHVVVHHPRKASGKGGAMTAAKKPAKKSAKTAVKRAAKKKAAKKSKAKSVAKKAPKKAVKKKKAKKGRS
jgi:hypothetical protein